MTPQIEKPYRFVVARQDLAHAGFIDDPDAPLARPLADGEARLRIEQFALTANNITYATFGEAMHYWQFFDATQADWGCVPAWGFATVCESRCAGLEPGLRVYGFLPMGQHLVVQPARLRERGFVDAAPRRLGLPPIYNDYLALAHDPLHADGREAMEALLRPLFTTAFLLADHLAEQRYHGARRLLMSSASSKTAWCTAVCLAQAAAAGTGTAAPAPERIGLTSRANLESVRSLGCYDRVLAYDEVATLEADVPSTYVDFAGNDALRRALHQHLGAALCHDTVIGASHWQALRPRADPQLPGPRPVLFFAPEQAVRRAAPPPQGWGPRGLEQAVSTGWHALLQRLEVAEPPWLVSVNVRGADSIALAFASLREGRIDPREGLILHPV
jgi:Protein of unknown function (DUF2855)